MDGIGRCVTVVQWFQKACIRWRTRCPTHPAASLSVRSTLVWWGRTSGSRWRPHQWRSNTKSTSRGTTWVRPVGIRALEDTSQIAVSFEYLHYLRYLLVSKIRYSGGNCSIYTILPTVNYPQHTLVQCHSPIAYPSWLPPQSACHSNTREPPRNGTIL